MADDAQSLAGGAGAAAPDVFPSQAGLGRYRWVICALLFFATTINYIDRQILALLKSTLDVELGWTNAQYGEVNAAFQAAYAVGLLAFGAFIDRFGSRVGYAVSIAAWSLAAIGHSLVHSVGGFFAARVSLGLGEGGNFPSAIKAVALWFPRRERAFATALFNSGTNVGAVIAPAVVPWLALTWGWRSAFIAAGVAGFLWLFLWIPFYDVPEKIARLTREELEHIRSDADAPAASAAMPWLDILRYRQAWAFILAKFMTDPVWWFFLTWLPDYFKTSRHLDIKNSAVYIVTIYSIVGVLSIGGTWVTGYLVRRGWSVNRARKTSMLAFAFCVIPVWTVDQVGSWGAVLLIGLAGAAHQAWSANLFTTASDMFPKRAVASVVGLGGMAGSIGGIMFPIFAGRLLDRFRGSGNPAAGYSILFAICGSAYLIAYAVNHLLAPRFEQVEISRDG
jgi:ACS family hexuronate transporter-like MFS transporter